MNHCQDNTIVNYCYPLDTQVKAWWCLSRPSLFSEGILVPRACKQGQLLNPLKGFGTACPSQTPTWNNGVLTFEYTCEVTMTFNV